MKNCAHCVFDVVLFFKICGCKDTKNILSIHSKQFFPTSFTYTILYRGMAKSINQFLTLRNWLLGYYIVEYEQNGEDRAKYGENLMQEIVNKLSASSAFRKTFRTAPLNYTQSLSCSIFSGKFALKYYYLPLPIDVESITLGSLAR